MLETKRARLRRTPWICGCGLVLATAAVLWLYLRSSHAQDLADPLRARRKGQPLPVRTAQVEEKQLEQVIGATALTVPSEIAPIRLGPSRELSTNGPLSNLTVRSVHVREGDLVHRDQVVLEVDTEMLEESLKHKQTTLAAAEAALAYVRENISYTQKLRELALEMAKAELQYRTTDLDRRQTEYDATNKLYQGSPSGSAWPAVSLFAYVNAFSQYIQAKYELAVARDRLERAKRAIPVGLLKDKQDLALALSAVEAALVDLKLARHDLQRLHIRSPLDGLVHFTNLTEPVPGMALEANQVLWMQILKLDPIHVQIDFPQERIDEVALGQKADVVLDSFPKETFSGTVVRIAPQVNAELRVLPVLVRLSNPKNRIKAGISGFARLRMTKQALVVPAQAILQQGSKSIVFRVENGKARARAVQTGQVVENGVVEIQSGLVRGDEVVIYFSNIYKNTGNLTKRNCYLQDGDPVDVDWPKWTGRSEG